MKKIYFKLIMILSIVSILSFTYVNNANKPKKKKAKTTKVKEKKKSKNKIADTLAWKNMTDGYAKAVNEKKILLVDVYTDWCYWCKVMDKETYTDSLIINKLNTYYVVVKFNPEEENKHTINGVEYSSTQLLQVLNKGGHFGGYPTTYFWKDLNDLTKIENYPGYRKKADFSSILDKFINQTVE